MKIQDLATPALVVDAAGLEQNLATMAAALPGDRCRPHVKAHKTTALARRQAAVGHRTFCAATPKEIVGMAAAGLGDDLLLANETVNGKRLRAMADCGARVTVAVDSPETVDAAAANGIREVLIDVDVGLPRCGCAPDQAGVIADLARARGMAVRGVMGYEGHVVGNVDRVWRTETTEQCMALLRAAHDDVGGDVMSGGGTGTFDINVWCTEIQAGSYALMDTAYAKLDLPFRQALWVEATVVSVSPKGWFVADCGLKALGMDHGDPSVEAGEVLFCSDEHVTIRPARARHRGSATGCGSGLHTSTRPSRWHERMQIADGDDIVETWEVDLRGWST